MALPTLLTADYDRSLARALGDPGRGLSKDSDFLRAAHLAYAQQLPMLPWDLRLDVEKHAPTAMAAQVLEHLPRS
jgi:hypothetical protein